MGILPKKDEEMKRLESSIQQEIVIFFKNNYCLKHHVPRCEIFSVPNEGRNKLETIHKKATGMLAGVSDLIILLPNRVVFVEVKTDVGRQSEHQIRFEQTVKALGLEYYLVRKLEDFKQIKINL